MNSSDNRNPSFLQKSNEYDEANNFNNLNLPRKARVMNTTRSEVKFKDVVLIKSGTLESVERQPSCYS